MFASVLSLLISMSGISVESLSDHSWIQSSLTESEIDCPIRFEFKGNKYRFYNPCPTKSRNGVIEWGTYRIDDDKLIFADRFVLVGGGSIFGEDAQPFVLIVEEVSASSILFRFGDQLLKVTNNGVSNW